VLVEEPVQATRCAMAEIVSAVRRSVGQGRCVWRGLIDVDAPLAIAPMVVARRRVLEAAAMLAQLLVLAEIGVPRVRYAGNAEIVI
jgi:hypothetical protein